MNRIPLLLLGAGLLLRLHRGITPVTGAFSMIAGGASGITAMNGRTAPAAIDESAQSSRPVPWMNSDGEPGMPCRR